jgi:hypothetical protein
MFTNITSWMLQNIHVMLVRWLKDSVYKLS